MKMNKTAIILSTLVVAVLFAACSGGSFKKTRSGLMYKIESTDKKNPVVKRGQILKLHFVQKVRDSVLADSYGKMPFYAPVDSVGPIYNPAEIFPLLRKGDSVTVVMLADTLAKKGGQLPPFINRKDKITLHFKILDIFPSDSLADIDRQAEMVKEQARQKGEAELQKGKDEKALAAYIAKNNIKANKTASGVYYEITSTVNGVPADTGKTVAIKYTGYTLDGKYFDSNMDSTKQVNKHPMDPFQFQAGVQGAIQGMLEGILHFKKGDKGRLLIPSTLAYGPNPPPGGIIKANESLIFDIELVDVQDAPAAQPNMPPPPPPHGGH